MGGGGVGGNSGMGVTPRGGGGGSTLEGSSTSQYRPSHHKYKYSLR